MTSPGQIDRQTNPGLAVHVICDNLSAYMAPVVHRWLAAHPIVQLPRARAGRVTGR